MKLFVRIFVCFGKITGVLYLAFIPKYIRETGILRGSALSKARYDLEERSDLSS